MVTELRISFRVPEGPLAQKVKSYLDRGMTLSDIVRYALASMPDFAPVPNPVEPTSPQEPPEPPSNIQESKSKTHALKALQNW